MTIDKKIDGLLGFFGMEPLDDVRDFQIKELEYAYVRMITATPIPEYIADVKHKYSLLKRHIGDSLKNVKPYTAAEVRSMYDELTASIKNVPSRG